MTENASEQFDLEGSIDFGIKPHDLHGIAHDLENAESVDWGQFEKEELAAWVEACKRLADAAEEARKESIEPELDDRVDVGQEVGNLNRMAGSQRYVKDDAEAFDAVLDAGYDPRDVASVKVTKLTDVLGEDASELLGEREYTYYRR